MLIEIKVPSPGESITEVEIANWLKQDGDVVSKDDELCEIDSDKATLTVNADQGGKISIKVAAGEKVNVGDVIATIDTSVEALAAKPAVSAPASAAAKATETAPVKESPAAPTNTSYASGTPSPAAAKIMAENGVKTTDVKGSGPAGRITKGDVLALLANGFGGKQATSNSREQSREKMTSLRRKLSQRLVSVKNETAMLTTFNEVDMSCKSSLQ
jgi:2-oxoglutarate dehydrogenase E2 component (dihydrolipoamide succinyltransferase)